MFTAAALRSNAKADQYAELAEQAEGLLAGERDLIANAANFAALVWHALPSINWCGFYFFDGTELVVGPFQGRPACVRIAQHLARGIDADNLRIRPARTQKRRGIPRSAAKINDAFRSLQRDTGQQVGSRARALRAEGKIGIWVPGHCSILRGGRA